ncbi:MAG: hypothetical protein A2782_02830 [Candidatus Blackburnbacteria bacterium RIFCSPHIGHO2_01_FULL_43_15b]|uniref:Methyltransferase type 11 domain-containing protein n=1 Tax=Candidatus Blackburnbacteria bacterium RIFCSPHIGHO2_01_FULL_43_15b TaxID=1797513 RepID=A0A1G1V317_9BACT|nr:MAG: hypothetical protein A2782_02830 [Candidatus Blackburnbacteria bacterium RIFCSPHIGHO2_01_FULL_43_15b]
MNSHLLARAAQRHKLVPPDHYARSIKQSFLHKFWHTRRFTQIGKMIEPSGGKVLDIGSADGTFTKVIVEKSKADGVIGIDVLPGSVSYAKRRFARSKVVSFRVADAHELPFLDKSFDAIFCLETLEHVEDPLKAACEMFRVLKEDGYAVVLVPNENFLFKTLWPIWLMGPGKIWRGTHIQDLSAEEITEILKRSGFTIKETRKFLCGMLQAVKVAKE